MRQLVYQDGSAKVPWTTMLGDTFKHADAHENKFPFELPASWTKHKGQINPKTPFNFLSTVDIIGGNSGSPVVNRAGEFVGIVFDGNLQSLPWEYAFSDKQGRAESVHSASILEALNKVYGARELTRELLRGQRPN